MAIMYMHSKNLIKHQLENVKLKANSSRRAAHNCIHSHRSKHINEKVNSIE